MKYLWLTPITLCLSCGPYALRVNENTVYNPPPVIVAELADEALRDCFTRSLADTSTLAINLTELTCSNAGVRSLAGLAAFERLSRIDLAGNELTEVAELASLPKLRQVDLSGNTQLLCSALTTLAATVDVTAPQHCR